MNTQINFQTGKIYTSRSICDHSCIWSVTVLKRTKKFLTIKVDGEREIKRAGVQVRDGEEICYFSGKYSMAPIIRAGRLQD